MIRWLVPLALLACPPAFGSPMKWQELGPGVHYGTVTLASASGDGGLLHVVRIDPRVAELRSLSAACTGSTPRTASEWCRDENLTVAINLGMFQQDHRSNVGYARCGACVSNGKWSASYKSALVLRPKRSGIPSAAILDLDQPPGRARAADYDCVIQNLRLIKASGRNVWSHQARKWSEAAIAQDRDGHILFLFCRAPYTMREFCRRLLGLPLRIQRAMHVEGGPEASLSIRSDRLRLDLNGSYETGFRENDDEPSQWPIPNVIGVAGAAAAR